MVESKCKYCGSNRIRWDYKNGIIVCENCGSVIEDKIFEETYPFFQEEKKTRITTYIEKNKEKELKKKALESYIYLKERPMEDNNLYAVQLEQLLNIDERFRSVYNKLINSGILSGKKTKTRIIFTIFFSNEEKSYNKYLKYFNITEKEFKETISQLKVRARLKITESLAD